MKNAYFAGGCFWCISPVLRSQPGVSSVTSGYCGGNVSNPTYEQVKSGLTGHRETVCITYDENHTSFEKLFQIYLWNIDPFDSEGQFIDRGHSYTLAVYCNDETERSVANNLLNKLKLESGKDPSISIEMYRAFYPAEDYHQNYDLKNPELFREELETSGRTVFFNERRSQ